MPAQRATVIGLAQFDGHESLGYAPELADRVGALLARFGYQVEHVVDQNASSAELGAGVTGFLASGGPDDLAIVHLTTHGRAGAGDSTVFALGCDCAVADGASIGHWLTMQEAAERPRTLFLLDLCFAGTVARLPWQPQLEKPFRGWVIAGCRPGAPTFDGRFSQAVVNVLEAIDRGELDVHSGLAHIPLPVVARAIRQEVERLVQADDAYEQHVTATMLDISADDDPPFFPNRGFDAGARPRLRTDIDPGVLPFLDDLDEGLDVRHFLERATGLGRLTDGTTLVGCFTGREEQLRDVAPWLSDGDEPLLIVTGSPGAGKSALLGVLVCAASPDLREPTKPIWRQVAQAPMRNPDLAAVHARQRGVATIVASIARQYNLPEALSTEDVITVLRQRQRRPVIVLDALDEADNPVRIMNELLLPLASRDEPGEPVRLLVGTRPYDVFESLFADARVVDLDDVDHTALREEILHYVIKLMRSVQDYCTATAAADGLTVAACAENSGLWRRTKRFRCFLSRPIRPDQAVNRPPRDQGRFRR